MTKQKKKPKLVFTPGCFDNFDGTQEELDEFIAEIKQMFESGEYIEKSIPLSELDLDDIEDLDEGQERKLH